jgi:hypothetical protein
MIDVTEPALSIVLAVRGTDAVPIEELAEFDGIASVSALERFATLLLLEPAEVMASCDESLIETEMPDAAPPAVSGTLKKACP